MAAQGQNSETRNLLIGLGVILLVVAIFFYLRSQKTGEISQTPTPEEIIVQEEGVVKRNGGMVQPLTDEEVKAMKDEVDNILSQAGTAASLKDVGNTGTWGEAKSAFSDGKYYFKLVASGLKIIEKGYYYEGWLGKEGQYISIGRVEVSEKGEGLLYYTSSEDKTSYNQVLVTTEPEDGNLAPATHLLEGQF